MSRPWRHREALLLGHSQMEGMAPFFVERLRQTRVRTIHQHIERGLNLRRLQRDIRLGRRQVIEPHVADELPFAIVALSGNGAVTDDRELHANIDWLRAEYPKALIAWLGHTITRTSDPVADEERDFAANLEAQVSARPGFIWVDMRLPGAPLAGDGIHHTREGYRQLAHHAWARIIQAADRRSRPIVPVMLGGAALGLAGVLGYRAWQHLREPGEDDPWR